MLWRDPQPNLGRAPSRRGPGAGVAFGPDVIENFLKVNNLKLVILSHEVKAEGYEITRNGKLVTVHGPTAKSNGAFVKLDGNMTRHYTTFAHISQRNPRPMQYARFPLS
eukprot:s1293_g6.t1